VSRTLIRLLPGILLICTLLPVSAAATTSPGLSQSEALGRQIYLTGVGAGETPITANYGPERIELPGEVATCGSCHGYDGRGRSESGINASDITWSALSKPQGHVHQGGRIHPPMTVDDLKTLITTGRYPDGTPADPAMPIYRLSEKDLDNLVAYLQRLGSLLDPGVGERTLRVGYLQWAQTPEATSEILEMTLKAYFDKLNQGGGIFDRKIDLVAVRPPEDPGKLEPWLMNQDLFALITPFAPGREDALAQAAQQTEIPLIGPYTLFPPTEFEANRYIFYLYPGLDEQLFLVYQGVAAEHGLKTAILYSAGQQLEQSARQLQGLLKGTASAGVWQLPDEPSQLDELIGSLQAEGVALVLLAGDTRAGRRLLQTAVDKGWMPAVGASGTLAGELLFESSPLPHGQLYLALPTIASDRNPAANVTRLLQDLTNDPAQVPIRVAALAAAELFTEALRRTGQRLDRRGLVSSLEKTYRFQTGLTPPLTYTANRRVGSDGIYLVTRRIEKQGSGQPETIQIRWITPPARH